MKLSAAATVITLLFAAVGVHAASKPVTYSFDIQLREFPPYFSPILVNSDGKFANGEITFIPQVESEGVQFSPGSDLNRYYPNQPYRASIEFDGIVHEIINSAAPVSRGYRANLLVQDLPSSWITYDLFEMSGTGFPITYKIEDGSNFTEITHTYIQWFGPATTLNDTNASVSNLEKIASINRPFDFTIFEIYGFTSGRASIGYLSNLQRVDAIPEPFTWTLLILGFSAVGLQLRQHRSAKSRTVSLPSNVPHTAPC